MRSPILFIHSRKGLEEEPSYNQVPLPHPHPKTLLWKLTAEEASIEHTDCWATGLIVMGKPCNSSLGSQIKGDPMSHKPSTGRATGVGSRNGMVSLKGIPSCCPTPVFPLQPTVLELHWCLICWVLFSFLIRIFISWVENYLFPVWQTVSSTAEIMCPVQSCLNLKTAIWPK